MDNDALQHKDDPSALLNINTASIEELEALPMIGSARAAATVKSRQDLGPFNSVDDLLRIPRLGKGTVSALRNLVRTLD